MFNVGDLVQLNYSEHIGIVIEVNDRNLAWGSPNYSYRIKWAVGEPFTWEKSDCLIMKARVDNEKSI